MTRPTPLAVARTRTLLDPLGPGAARVIDVDARVTAALAPLVEGFSAADPVIITVPTLRHALVDPDRLGRPEEPFRWRPAFVRRSLGLAAVEACASGRFRAPADAVGPIAEEAVAGWEHTGWRTFHWEPWLAGLPSGARAVVLAEAVGWSTALWSSLDWRALAPDARMGGPYDQWVCPGPTPVRLKARSELRVPLAQPGVGPGSHGGPSTVRQVALVSVNSGSPAPGWADELAFLALVAGLRSTARLAPARVVGLWPEAGIHRCVEIDTVTVDRVVDRVVATVAAVVAGRQLVAA